MRVRFSVYILNIGSAAFCCMRTFFGRRRRRLRLSSDSVSTCALCFKSALDVLHANRRRQRPHPIRAMCFVVVVARRQNILEGAIFKFSKKFSHFGQKFSNGVQEKYFVLSGVAKLDKEMPCMCAIISAKKKWPNNNASETQI